jgi:hypothetical protein
MKSDLIRLAAVAVVAGGGVFNASAAFDVYYQIANTSGGPGDSGYQDLDNVNVQFNGTQYNNILSGGIAIQEISQTGGPAMPKNYLTVCTDFMGSLYLGSTYKYSAPASSFSTVLGQPTHGGIAPPWNNPSKAIQNAAQIFYTYGDIGAGGINTGSGTALSADQMAALQVAIWIALYDTTSGGTVNTSGPFQLLGGPSDLAGIVATDINNLDGNYNNTGYLLQPDPLNSTQGNGDGQLPQELLMGSAVPEPATVLAGLMLAIPLGVSTVRILRKQKTNLV